MTEGEAKMFSAAGGSPPYLWYFVHNASGAVIEPNTGQYVAGQALPAGDEFSRENLALTIPDYSSSSPSGITNVLVVNSSIIVTDLNVSLSISHTYREDLTVDLVSPQGTTVRLHNRSGGDADNVYRTYDDQMGVPPDGPGTLADFNGQSVQGTWKLIVRDEAPQDVGTLNAWSLIVNGGRVSTLDIIEARNANGLIGRAYVNVVGFQRGHPDRQSHHYCWPEDHLRCHVGRDRLPGRPGL